LAQAILAQIVSKRGTRHLVAQVFQLVRISSIMMHAITVLAVAALLSPPITSSAMAGNSAIQKIVQMLDEAKAKTAAELEAESKEMEKYTTFCDNEASDKNYAIETASRQLEDLSATIQDATATVASRSEEIGELGNEIASMNDQAAQAKTDREAERETFQEGETSIKQTIGQLGQAIALVKKAMQAIKEGQSVSDAPIGDEEPEEAAAAEGAFLQISQRLRNKSAFGIVAKEQLHKIMAALSSVIEAESVDSDSKAQLQSFIETSKGLAQNDNDDGDDGFDLALAQQMMKPWRGKSTAGAETKDALKNAGLGKKKPPSLTDTLERMQGQGEERLSEMQAKEMKAKFAFQMLSQGLGQEIAHTTDKLATATEDKAQNTQTLEEANAKSADVMASKSADERLRSTLATECQSKAVEWEQRMRDANGEMSAIDKAKDILLKGVKVLMQVNSHTRRAHRDIAELQESNGEGSLRKRLGDSLRSLAQQRHSFGLAQLVASVENDPFAKVRGLVESMLAKLTREAAEAATKEAFCQEEIGKSKKSVADKSAAADKHKTRMDLAATTIAELTQAVQTLTAEIAETDRTQAEATQLRADERAEYKQASSDQKISTDAVAQAIDVLKSYYNSVSLLQASTKRQPSFGGNQGGSVTTGVVGLLEIVQDDITKLLAETEATESEAATAFKKLTNENEISRVTKDAEVKGKQSEIKTLKVQLAHSTGDYEGVAKELDTVTGYLAKLEPECAGSSLTYAEKKAAREAEISGLKDGLSILDGEGLALAQTGRRSHLRRSGRHA